MSTTAKTALKREREENISSSPNLSGCNTGTIVNLAMAEMQDIDPGKALILEAAAECFMESGFNMTSIDDVATRLLATKGRIYHYYRSKADLFFDVHRTGMRINLGTIEPIANAGGPALERFEAMCRSHLFNMLHSISFQRVVMQGVEMHLAGRTTKQERNKLELLMEEREQYEHLFQSVLLDGRQAGAFQFENPSFTSKAVLAVLNNPVIWYQRRDSESDAERQSIIDEFTQFALNCVKAK
ncbi:MAG: TetR/AcrR family transcriptional regulator [Salaquimonas sp.]